MSIEKARHMLKHNIYKSQGYVYISMPCYNELMNALGEEDSETEKENVEPDYTKYMSIEWLKNYAILCCSFDMNMSAIHFVNTWIKMHEKFCCEKKEALIK